MSLSNAEIDRLDFLHNRIHEMVEDVVGKELVWDMELIGEISDVVEDYVVKNNIMTAQEFAPYVEVQV